MKIIITGAGELGTHLATLLSYEYFDITLIDINPEALAYAKTHLDIRTLEGNATSIATLEEAEVAETDLVIAVSSIETVNITTCVLAKQLGAKRTIARVYNLEFIEDRNKIGFKRFGIDELISLEDLAAKEINQLLSQTAFDDAYEFEDGALQMLGIHLLKSSPIIGKTIKDVGMDNPNWSFIPVAMKRSGSQKTIIPHGGTKFKKGDQVYFIAEKEGLKQIIERVGRKTKKLEHIMILGGGEIGRITAKNLSEKGLHVKLIESNTGEAEKLAQELPKVMIIHADGRDMDILIEESIDEMDCFISVTGNSETNIMTCLSAKSKNVKKTIALVENIGYFHLYHSLGIDTLINKKTLAANKIFKYVRQGKIVAINTLTNMNAQLVEYVITEKTKAHGKKIKELNLPEEAIIGGVIRQKKGFIALGDFKIMAGDKLVICCLPPVIKKIEKLFR